jgi:Zinc finger, C3HC4 type (RING finger)/WWE domain
MIDTERCPACLENISTPITLECSHRLCYLCLKTMLRRDLKKCVVCRAVISGSYFEDAVEPMSNKPEISGYKWLYSGRNGDWWYFDEISDKIIEKGYSEYNSGGGAINVQLVICSSTYTIDFDNFTQTKLYSNGSRDMLRINTDHIPPNISIKGIAGVRYINMISQ